MSLPLLKPELFAVTATGPALLGGECACGYVFFPMQRYGCERCGKFGAALQPKSLVGRGTLVTASVVHTHADKRRVAPFAIGTIALEEGPVIRALLSDLEAGTGLQSRVEAEFVPVALEDGTGALDLRFRQLSA